MTPHDRKWILLRALEANAAKYNADLVPSVVMLGQSALETGDFTSDLVTQYNNAFGMQMPKVRATTANGSVPAEDGAEFATYATLEDSAIDYLMRQMEFNLPNTQDAATYMEATIDSGYATDPDYLAKWAEKVYALNAGGMGDPPPSPDAEVGPLADNAKDGTPLLLGALALFMLSQ